MGIHIDIRLDFTSRQKKIVRAATVSGAVIAALGLGLAVAAPHQWATSDPLRAADLNGLNVVTTDAGAYSVGATKYCGTGPTNTTGAISYNSRTGYSGAKAMCEASSGCGTSATAHMCMPEELVRSAALGIVVPNGRYATGVGWTSYPTTNYIDGRDCAGYTTAQAIAPGSEAAAVWNGSTSQYAGAGGDCSSMLPVLCCD